MNISFLSEGIKKPRFPYKFISEWLKGIVLKYNKSVGQITYIFCDDEYLLEINVKYLRHDFYTDIVTFDYCENDVISGDLFISLDRVSENAELFGVSFNEEFLRVIVHGLLHLLGYGDHTVSEKRLMRELENQCLLLYKTSW